MNFDVERRKRIRNAGKLIKMLLQSHRDSVWFGMPAAKYRPIIEIQRNGTVSRAAIKRAVKKLAELKRNHPARYRAKIRSSASTPVRLVVKHT
jgi:hypothetical protein